MKFDPERACRAALALLHREGLEKLTMRALATDLGVQAPSLYYYFPAKQDLLDAMADVMAAEALERVDWTQDAGNLPFVMARALRATLLSYADGARVFSGAYAPTSAVLRFTDRMMGALLTRSGKTRSVAHTTFNLLYYVTGFVIEEQAFIQKWSLSNGTDDRCAAETELRRSVADGFPSLARCLDDIIDADFETRFESGLVALLAGA